jgi:two-component system sensor histidine kinase UhpB
MTTLTDREAAAAAADGRPRQPPEPAGRRRYLPLLHRVAGINAALVVVAVTVTILVLAPGKVSALALDEEVAVVLAAVGVVVLANLYLLRRIVSPLQALTRFARAVDLDGLRDRMPDAQPTSEAGELALTFNEMLSRLESERREASARVLRAQEDERLRIAQELHDQVGQDLTAVLLGLSRVASHAPDRLRAEVGSVQEAVRGSLEEVRRIAIELRPEALDDLGLANSLAVLAERFSHQLGLDVTFTIAPGLPPLPSETELVTYRVAQESLTNVARHSASTRASLTLERHQRSLLLTVRDYGLGLPRRTVAGSGIRGMRERAAVIGARLDVGSPPSGPGCQVRLEVPLGEERS